MLPKLPMCCSPRAYEMFTRQIPRLESPQGLIYAATAISAHQLEKVDPVQVDQQLARLAQTVRSRVRGNQPQAMLAHLHELLFEEEKFAGNTDDYYNPANSYLPVTLKAKLGLPITLSLIYVNVAQRLGLDAWGVGLPGHFIVGMEVDRIRMLIDPFTGGRVVTPDEAYEQLQDMFGPEVEWSEDLLEPIFHRNWLTRMLQNLLTTFGSSGHYADVAAVLEMEMLLWPEEDRLQRDLALVLARLGLAQPAYLWLDHYLNNHPDDPQQTDLKQLLAVLQA